MTLVTFSTPEFSWIALLYALAVTLVGVFTWYWEVHGAVEFEFLRNDAVIASGDFAGENFVANFVGYFGDALWDDDRL